MEVWKVRVKCCVTRKFGNFGYNAAKSGDFAESPQSLNFAEWEKVKVVVQKEEEEIKEERLHGEMREELLLVELVIEREALRLAG